MKTSQRINTTIASFEMGVEMSDNIPRLPLPSSNLSRPTEREFLLHAFSKLCRKRGRESARCTFAKRK